MIKLLTLDLDGTVLDSRGRIPRENIEAIRSAEEAGVLVTIATGRRFRDARPVGIELDLNAPLITHNGALLKYAGTLEPVAFSLLESERSYEIIRVGKTFGGDALLSADPYGKGTLFYDRVSEDNVPLQKYLAWSRGLHGDEADEAVHHVKRLEDILHKHEVIHISFSGTCERMADLQDVLRSELGDSVTLLATIYPHLDFTLLDILPAEASKGVGVRRLRSRTPQPRPGVHDAAGRGRPARCPVVGVAMPDPVPSRPHAGRARPRERGGPVNRAGGVRAVPGE